MSYFTIVTNFASFLVHLKCAKKQLAWFLISVGFLNHVSDEKLLKLLNHALEHGIDIVHSHLLGK